MIIVSSSEFKTGRRSVRAAGHTAASLGCGKVKSRNYVGNWSGAWQVAMAMKASSWLFLSRRFLYFFMSLWLRQRGRVVRGEVIRFQWVDAQLQQSVTASDEEKKLEFVFFFLLNRRSFRHNLFKLLVVTVTLFMSWKRNIDFVTEAKFHQLVYTRPSAVCRL